MPEQDQRVDGVLETNPNPQDTISINDPRINDDVANVILCFLNPRYPKGIRTVDGVSTDLECAMGHVIEVIDDNYDLFELQNSSGARTSPGQNKYKIKRDILRQEYPDFYQNVIAPRVEQIQAETPHEIYRVRRTDTNQFLRKSQRQGNGWEDWGTCFNRKPTRTARNIIELMSRENPGFDPETIEIVAFELVESRLVDFDRSPPAATADSGNECMEIEEQPRQDRSVQLEVDNDHDDLFDPLDDIDHDDSW